MAPKKSTLKNRFSSKAVHFIGIGGIGMSALARWYMSQNWAISGSDIETSRITRGLQKDGVKVRIGHKRGNLPAKTNLIIYSQAIRPDNPELQTGRRLKIPAISYPEAVGALTRRYKTIAIAGAHGKSTTTALIGLILKKAGLDPTIIVGTELKELGNKNFRLGHGPYLILEADEFGRAFLHYSPALTVITNIDREHLDAYKNLRGVKNAFLKFLERTKNGGVLVLNKDNKAITSLIQRIKGIARDRKLRTMWYAIRGNTAEKIREVIKIPGLHNISNAVAAYKIGRALDIPNRKILSAISRYRGAWRRMEYRGKFKGALVFDDYAHHPTEIKATLQAFKEKYPSKKILCVFQPHQGKRLAALFREFQSAFDLADETLILPLYAVAGRDEKTKLDSRALVRAIQKNQPKKLLFYLEKPRNLRKAVLSLCSPLSNKVIVMMGAGDIVNYTDSLLRWENV